MGVQQDITRRSFITWLVGLVALLKTIGRVRHTAAQSSPVEPPQRSSKRPAPARVVIERNPKVMKDGVVDTAILISMVNTAVMKLVEADSPAAAWQELSSPDDRVGIKVNCLGGRLIATRPEVAYAVAEGLLLAGVKKENIIIWDRTEADLIRGGYTIQREKTGIRCIGTDSLSYGGYEREPAVVGSVGSCFSRILTRFCTAVVNLPVLKDHDLAGVSLGMKNFYGAIHNPNKYHDNNCNPYIADLCTYAGIKDKLMLTLCDALTGVYHGGPAYKPQWAWDYSGILASRDVVALDRVGAHLIDTTRAEKGLPSLKASEREPVWIATAAKLGLGEGDLSKIEVVG